MSEPLSFVQTGLPVRAVFGAGSFAQIKSETERLGAKRALLLSTPGRRILADEAEKLMGDLSVGIFDQCKEHLPEDSTAAVREAAKAAKADCVIAMGGGSTIGHGKAVALVQDVTLIHVPTTYSGSEMTPVQGFTVGGVKRSMFDSKMLAKTIIYDPQLTLTLPPETAGPSGINALAHCVEAVYGAQATPITTLFAEEGARVLSSALRLVIKNPRDIEARSNALYGAYLSGNAMLAGAGIHHHIAHVLGGTFGMNHSLAHTVILPHAAAYNETVAPGLAKLASIIGDGSIGASLFTLCKGLGIDMRLSAHGFRAEDLDSAAEHAAQPRFPNPRPPSVAAMRDLLDDAFHGREPRTWPAPQIAQQ